MDHTYPSTCSHPYMGESIQQVPSRETIIQPGTSLLVVSFPPDEYASQLLETCVPLGPTVSWAMLFANV